jgi:hypothetical protein
MWPQLFRGGQQLLRKAYLGKDELGTGNGILGVE